MENLDLEIAKEVERLTLEGMTYDKALIKPKEIYKNVQSPATKQGKEHTKSINDIIPLGTDIDNNDLFIQKGDMYI